MHRHTITLLCALTFVGCDTTVQGYSDGGCATTKDGCPVCPMLPDLAAQPCAAAKGLNGVVLDGLCLDMNAIDTAGLTTKGFTLGAQMTNCGGWEVNGSALQPKGIMTGSGSATCGFALPSIPVSASKYPKVTLALIHQANLPTNGQTGEIDLPAQKIWYSPPTTPVDQRTIIEIDSSKLSGGLLQVAVQLFAPAASGTPTWAISSIAVLGQPAQ